MFGGPYIDSPGDQSVGAWDTAGEVTMSAGPGGAGHISLAAAVLMLIGLKAFTESNLVTTDLAEIKLSLLNIVSVMAIVIPGIVGFKWVTAEMTKRGVALPGQAELAMAI